MGTQRAGNIGSLLGYGRISIIDGLSAGSWFGGGPEGGGTRCEDGRESQGSIEVENNCKFIFMVDRTTDSLVIL